MSELKYLPQDAVVWGHDAVMQNMARLGSYGIEKPIVFAAKSLLPVFRTHIAPHLENSVGMVTDLPQHAPDFAVRSALDTSVSTGARSIIALGGGSVLDAAKAVSHFHEIRTGSHLPIAALPTTLSGSEFSHYFGVTETAGRQKFKRSYAVRETVPKIILIDPVLIENTPRSLLLSSAIKGIDHAVEGMRKVECDHPHSIMAVSGVERFLSTLERWPAVDETAEALRSRKISHDDLLQLQLAAWQCYFYPASVIYGLSHRIGHILGGTYGLPHSATSCVTLAPVIRACRDFYGDKLQAFTQAATAGTAASALADRISDVVRFLGLPDKVSDFGLSRQTVGSVATLLVHNYPEEVADLGENSSAKLVDLLERIW